MRQRTKSIEYAVLCVYSLIHVHQCTVHEEEKTKRHNLSTHQTEISIYLISLLSIGVQTE